MFVLRRCMGVLHGCMGVLCGCMGVFVGVLVYVVRWFYYSQGSFLKNYWRNISRNSFRKR